MANENLLDPADLTDQQLLDLAGSRPKVYKALTDADPRVQPHERTYNAHGTLKVDGKDMKFREVVEEMGVRIAPDSNIARARRHAKAEIQDDVLAIKKMRKELEDRESQQRLENFRERLRTRATELGYQPKDD